MPTRAESGAMVTGREKFDDWFARAADLEARVQEANARTAALLRPLGLALELPDDFTTGDLGAALKKVARVAAKGGAHPKLVVAAVAKPRPGLPPEEAQLTNKGKPLEPHPQLILDTTVATLRQVIAVRADLSAMEIEADSLKVESEALTNDVLSTFRSDSKPYRDAVVSEIQARWKALGDLGGRAKKAADAAGAVVAQISSSVSAS